MKLKVCLEGALKPFALVNRYRIVKLFFPKIKEKLRARRPSAMGWIVDGSEYKGIKYMDTVLSEPQESYESNDCCDDILSTDES